MAVYYMKPVTIILFSTLAFKKFFHAFVTAASVIFAPATNMYFLPAGQYSANTIVPFSLIH